MKKTLADLFGQTRKLEAALAARIEGTARKVAGPPASRAPLEIVHAILEAVEREIQPTGRGQRAFPFTHVRVLLVAPTPRDKAHLLAVCEGPQPLERRIADLLRTSGCPVADVSVKLSYVAAARPDWIAPEFHLEYARRAPSTGTVPAPAPGPRLELTVTAGTTGRTSYSFGGTPVAVGRGAEVRDTRQRLIRTNHLAFAEDGSDVNASVSRRHARVEHDPASHAFRVYDDGSAQGTVVMRHGEALPVPQGTRGLRLQSGDELVLGRARVRVKIAEG